jgi:hypothetical protein
MRPFEVKTIPIADQRYSTAGDYFIEENGSVQFRITEQKHPDYEFLIALHEIIEEYLTRRAGIREQDILAYDLHWEKRHAKGLTTAAEPGHEPGCIYRDQHVFAEIIEGLVALELGIDFDKYDKEIIYQQ